MSALYSGRHGCAEDHPTLLLQLPMWVDSSHFVSSCLHVLHLSANPLHRCDFHHHHITNNHYHGAVSAVAPEIVSRSLLAFSVEQY
jgi:hypothetical protein